MPATPHGPAPRRAAFILTIWAETVPADAPTWRGYLEGGDGQRRYFASLAGLNQLLIEVGGWVDLPLSTGHVRSKE